MTRRDTRSALSRFGEHLATRRDAAGVSQRQLSTKLKLRNHGDISLWETGRRLMPARHVGPIARALGTDPAETARLREAAADELKRLRALRSIGLQLEPGGAVSNVDARSRTPNFTGRERELERLAAEFRDTRPNGGTQALVGMPGVGKTQLALQYAVRNAAKYDIIWRLIATEPAALRAQLAGLAPLLELSADETDDDAADLVEEALGRSGRWLLIVDNADKPADVRWLCATDGGGHVIVTSRRTAWRSLARTTTLRPFSIAEGSVFLLDRTGSRGDPGPVVRALGGLPLALDQAGSAIESDGSTFALFGERLQTQPADTLGRGESAIADAGVLETLAAAINSVGDESSTERRVLSATALLGDAPIPRDLLGVDAVELGRAVAQLAALSLVRQDDAAVEVHQLVQLALRQSMHEAELQLLANAMAARLVGALPTEIRSASDVRRFAALLPHVVALPARVGEPDLDMGIALSRCGAFLDLMSQPTDAEALIRQAIDIFRRLNSTELLADALHNLGGNLDNQGRPTDAAAAFRDSLAARESLDGPDPVRSAGTRGMLAQALLATGAVDEGERMLRAALADLDAHAGSDHPYTLVAQGNLSLWLEGRGHHDEASELRTQALRTAELRYGDTHPATAGALVNLALSADPALSNADRLDFVERAIESRQTLGLYRDDIQAELRAQLEELRRA